MVGDTRSHKPHRSSRENHDSSKDSGKDVRRSSGRSSRPKRKPDEKRSSDRESKGGGERMVRQLSQLYRHARKCEWDAVEEAIKFRPDEVKSVYDRDGTTALHLAVMSRTGYIYRNGEADKDKYPPAPLEIIEKLLRAWPEAGMMRCKQNSYTPLAYACYVWGNGYHLETSADMVRVFLEICPESASVFTKRGLSALDVHVVSYSRFHEKKKEETLFSGRTSTVLLRSILERSPGLAVTRVHHDKVMGPIEFLYKSNSRAFKDTIKDQSQAHEQRKSVMSNVSNWWVWKWTIMILKYAALDKRKKGVRFNAVHAASGLPGCPLAVLSLTVYAFPKQVETRDSTKDDANNLPLHTVCSWPCQQDVLSPTPLVSSRKVEAIKFLLGEYPEAAKMTNNFGDTPLDIAVKTGTTWDGGLRQLARACPNVISRQNLNTGLYPFMSAAVVAHNAIERKPNRSLSIGEIKNRRKIATQTMLNSIQASFLLLRAGPEALTHFVKGGDVVSVSDPFGDIGLETDVLDIIDDGSVGSTSSESDSLSPQEAFNGPQTPYNCRNTSNGSNFSMEEFYKKAPASHRGATLHDSGLSFDELQLEPPTVFEGEVSNDGSPRVGNKAQDKADPFLKFGNESFQALGHESFNIAAGHESCAAFTNSVQNGNWYDSNHCP